MRLTPTFVEGYTAACEHVLAAILVNAEHLTAARQYLPDGSLLPTVMADAYNTAIRLADAGEIVTPVTVAAHSVAPVNELEMYAIYGRVMTAAEVDADVQIVLDRGRRMAASVVGTKLTTGEIDLADAEDQLQHIELYGASSSSYNAVEADDALEELMQAQPDQSPDMGLGVLDTWSFSMTPGMGTMILGKYGGRKSSLMRNMILAAASRQRPVTVLLPDGDQRQFAQLFAAECIVMIAAQWLKANAHDTAVEPMTGRGLMAGRVWRQNKTLVAAVERAREIWRTLPILMFGPGDCADPVRMMAEIRRDVNRRGPGILALDYIQHSGIYWPGDGIYERMVNATRFVADVTRLGHHAIILSQKNEASIRSSSDSPGTKGGGDLNAQVRLIIEPTYDSELMNREIKFETQKRNDGQYGSVRYEIEPVTGLLTGWHGGQQNDVHRIHIIPAEYIAAQQLELNGGVV